MADLGPATAAEGGDVRNCRGGAGTEDKGLLGGTEDQPGGDRDRRNSVGGLLSEGVPPDEDKMESCPQGNGVLGEPCPEVDRDQTHPLPGDPGDRTFPLPSDPADQRHPLLPGDPGDRTHPLTESCLQMSQSGDRTHPLPDWTHLSYPGGNQTHPPCPEGDQAHPRCPEGDRTHPQQDNQALTPNAVNGPSINSGTDSEVKGHTGIQRRDKPLDSLSEEEDVLFDSERTRLGSVTRTSGEGTEATNGSTDDVRVPEERNTLCASNGLQNGPDDPAKHGDNNGGCDDGRYGDGHHGDHTCMEPVDEIVCDREGESVEGTIDKKAVSTETSGPLDNVGSPDHDLIAKVRLLEEQNAELSSQLVAGKEREASLQEVAKELESKCFHQQERIEKQEQEGERKMQLSQQQEKELLQKVEQVSKQWEDADRDKSSVIGRLAVLQADQRKLIDQITDKDKRVKELSKENEKLDVLVKKQRAEVLKLQGNLEKAEAHSKQLAQDLSKEKSEVSSLNTKAKWAQNKLKTETEAHKNVKSQLEATAKKLKQAQEEGGQIRADMKLMIQRYQESEDMKSNSLDIKLKKTERELKQQEQEIADQQDLHELTVKELELAKASHKIAQEEVQHHKQKLSELNGRLTELITEIEEQKGTIAKQKQENKRLTSELSELEQRTQGFEKERVKFTQLREVFTQLQKSNQHLERELEKRKEREAELLTFSANLSSSNAELTAERSDWEAKVTRLDSERDGLLNSLSECKDTEAQLREELKTVHEASQAELASLLDKLDSKTKAVEQLSMALEDERELVKAVKKKNANVIKDLQKQLQSSNRRIEGLEASISSEREPAATLPISRASSHSSLDGVMGTSAVSPLTTSLRHAHTARDTPLAITTANENTIVGAPATISLSDDERAAASPSPEYKFSTMDQEKIMLVEKMCQLKKELVKQEEKAEFFEEHIAQLTEEIQGKSRIIQNFIMREQTGALAPPSFDANKMRQVQKGGVMGSVFSGKNSRLYKLPEVNYELSLEMNKKMQSVLEDTLLKNIQLKESIDTLGREIQRISAQLQTYEKLKR